MSNAPDDAPHDAPLAPEAPKPWEQRIIYSHEQEYPGPREAEPLDSATVVPSHDEDDDLDPMFRMDDDDEEEQ